MPKVIHTKTRKLNLILALSTMIMLATIYSICSIPISANAEEPVLADNTSSVFSLSSDRSLTVSVSSANIDLALTPSADGIFKSTSDTPLTVTVSTNNATGYNLNMTTTTTDLTRTTSLSGQTPVIHTLSGSGSFTSDTFETNAWGFSLDGATYQPVTLSRQITQTTKESNNSTTNITFAAKLNNEIPHGEYRSTITFIATTNPLEATFDTAFDAAGKTQVSYNGNNYYKMQDISGFICSMVATPTDATALTTQSTQLIDTRDNSVYWVSKLLDGNCWMTQNLDLNLDSNVTLTNADTDLNSVTSWTPVRSTIDSTGYGNITTCSSQDSAGTGCWGQTNTGFTSTSGNELWDDDNNTLYSDNPGYRYMIPKILDTPNPDGQWYANGDTFANCSTQDTNCGGQGHYMIGNYYNFAAANATNSVAGTVGHTVTDSDADYVMPNSICPKGWRMPLGHSSNNDFTTLITAYNIYGTNAMAFNFQGLNAVRRAPLYFVRSGLVGGGTLLSAGADGYAGSSTVSSSTDGYYLGFNGMGIGPAGSNTRARGFPVRCLARTDLTIEDATYLQDVTPEMRQNTAIGTETRLIDKRDNKTYWIAKLADGNVWMTQSLDLDLNNSVTLTSADTDLNSIATWTPSNSTSDSTPTKCPDIQYGAVRNECFGQGWTNNYRLPSSTDPGDRYVLPTEKNSVGEEFHDTIYNSLEECESARLRMGLQSDCSHYKLGNYYNFPAAVASNNADSSTQYYTEPNSICPAGWRLPNVSSVKDDFYSLMLTYGIDIKDESNPKSYDPDGINFIRNNPLYIYFSGYVTYNGLINAGIGGNLYSSTISASRDSYALDVWGKGISTGSNIYRISGLQVRCMLR